jgi:hypothetical protein
VASNVVHLLMDFLGGDGALPVVEFVREIVEVSGYSNVVEVIACYYTFPSVCSGH